MDTSRYLVEEFIEEYRLGHYGFEELRRRVSAVTDDLSVLDGLPRVEGRRRPAAVAGAENPWLQGPHKVSGSMMTYDSGGQQIQAYLARPAEQGPRPGIVVVHENKGLVEYVKDVAAGLASSGYVALAPDLLSREGGTSGFADPVTEVPGVISKIPPERNVQDLRAAVDYLAGTANAVPVGVIGFCFGGGMTWRLATKESRLAAAVPFYGPNPPLEDVPNISAPVLAVYGERDDRINQGIDAIRAAMAEHGKQFEYTIYPSAEHAFHNHTNPDRHNAEAAQKAWQQALDWFKRYLGQ